MKNGFDLIHLPELSLPYASLKKYLKNLYNLNLTPNEMGFFSFKTSDTKRTIYNDSSRRGPSPSPVYMITEDGRSWREDSYGGYGGFGGKDIFELIAEMNGGKTRDDAWSIVFTRGIEKGGKKYYQGMYPGADFTNYQDDKIKAEGNLSANELREKHGWKDFGGGMDFTEAAKEGFKLPKLVEHLPNKADWDKVWKKLPYPKNAANQGLADGGGVGDEYPDFIDSEAAKHGKDLKEDYSVFINDLRQHLSKGKRRYTTHTTHKGTLHPALSSLTIEKGKGRYVPAQARGKWYVYDSSNKEIMADVMFSKHKKHPYLTRQEAVSVASDKNAELERYMMDWGKDGKEIMKSEIDAKDMWENFTHDEKMDFLDRELPHAELSPEEFEKKFGHHRSVLSYYFANLSWEDPAFADVKQTIINYAMNKSFNDLRKKFPFLGAADGKDLKTITRAKATAIWSWFKNNDEMFIGMNSKQNFADLIADKYNLEPALAYMIVNTMYAGGNDETVYEKVTTEYPTFKKSNGGYAAKGKDLKTLEQAYAKAKAEGDIDAMEDLEFDILEAQGIYKKLPGTSGHFEIVGQTAGGEKSTILYFREGTSDKEYHIQLEKSGSGYVVNFQYGRRGGPLQEGTKTPTPVSLPAAEIIFEKLKHEKERKGYHEGMAGGGKISDLDSTTLSSVNEIIDYLEKEFGGKVTASRMTGSMKNYIMFKKRGGSFYEFNDQWTKNPKYNKILQDKFGFEVFMDNSRVNIELLGQRLMTNDEENYDLLYSFVDDKMVDGDDVAERMIKDKGYSLTYDELYNFVDEKRVEGDPVAERILGRMTKLTAAKGKKLKSHQISDDDFWNNYKPQINHIEKAKHPNTPENSVAAYGGTMYETYGEDIAYIKSLGNSGQANRIWTIVDADGDDVIQAGFWTVNRIGYIVTEKPWVKEGIEVAANGKKVGGVSDKVYIDFLNKDKRHQQDRKYFDTYEKAVKWAKSNFESFNPDMIKYVSYAANGTSISGWVVGDILKSKDSYVTVIDVDKRSEGIAVFQSDKDGMAITSESGTGHSMFFWEYEWKNWTKSGHRELKKVTKHGVSYYESGSPKLDVYRSLLDERYQFFAENAPKNLKSKFDRLEDENYHYTCAELVNDFFNHPTWKRIKNHKLAAEDGVEVGTKWTYEIKVFNDPKYYGHGRTWDTKEEAEQAGKEKLNNWMNAEDFRVVQATEKAVRGKVIPGKVGYFVKLQQDTPNQVRYLQIGINTDGSFTGMAFDYVGGGVYDTFWILKNEIIEGEEDEDGDIMGPDEQEEFLKNALAKKYGKDFSDKVMTDINKMFAEWFTYEDNGTVTTSLSDFDTYGIDQSYASFPRVNVGNTMFGEDGVMTKDGKKIGFAVGKKYWNSAEGGPYTYTHSDESGRPHFNGADGIDRIFSPGKMSEMTDKAGDGMFTEGEFDKIVADVKKYLDTVPYIWTKGNKKYVPIEGWQYAAAVMGLTSRVVDIKPVPEKHGWLAQAEVVNKQGIVVCSGFGFVGRDEKKWEKSIESDLESFAQTRAVSRALRNCISYIIKAAGYSTTPAEEMYGIEGNKSFTRPGSNKGVVSPIRPIVGVDVTDGMTRPEHKDVIQPPVVKVAKVDPGNLETILMAVWSEAKGNNIVLVDAGYMQGIEDSLMGGLTETGYHKMLQKILGWLIDNNIVLKSKPFMKKIKEALNEENN